MKKVLALVLAVVLCMGLGTVAFAAAAAGTKDPISTTTGSEKIELTVLMTDTDLKASDLKASISWEEGKDLFDKVELDDGDAAGKIKVTVKFNDYFGTDAKDVEFTLSLKEKSAKEEFKLDMAADAIATNWKLDGAAAQTETAGKELTVLATFDWDDITKAGDNDDAEIAVVNGDGAVLFGDATGDDKVTYATFTFGDDAAEDIDAVTVAGKMSKQDVVNMYLDTAVNDEIKALMKKNEDVDFDVLNFKGKPEFDFTQEVTYVIDDEEKEYFVYEIKNGKATKVNAKLNDDKDALVWKTRVLGCYIVTDAEIKAADAAAEDGDKTETGDKENPETGASDFVGVAVALGTVSLVAAGAVALKK